MPNQNSQTTKKKSTGKRIILWLSIFIIISVLAFFNLNRLVASYIYLLGSDSFSNGDNIYLTEKLWQGNFDTIIEPKLIIPLTVKEVKDSLLVDKESLVLALNNSLKPYVTNLSFGIEKEKLKKNSSGKIGTFIEKVILPTNTQDGKKALSVFYVVKPDPSILYNNFSKLDMPKGYKFADDYLYVFYSDASNKELANFNK